MALPGIIITMDTQPPGKLVMICYCAFFACTHFRKFMKFWSLQKMSLITARKWGCGKVMFSEPSVCPQVGCVSQHTPGQGVRIRACIWVGGACGQWSVQHPPPSPPPPRDGYWSGRYTSYWNTYLFYWIFIFQLIKLIEQSLVMNSKENSILTVWNFVHTCTN